MVRYLHNEIVYIDDQSQHLLFIRWSFVRKFYDLADDD